MVQTTDGAANFADTREADFSKAGSFSDLGELPEAVVKKQTRPDPMWQIWLIVCGCAGLLIFEIVKALSGRSL